ncbi:MAG: hypothetical protein M2R46_01834 [Verrucomicrobia subdivision 3 bacterium]|nr:hypothetical protein [Limisphaerales bacterium]
MEAAGGIFGIAFTGLGTTHSIALTLRNNKEAKEECFRAYNGAIASLTERMKQNG